MSSYVQQNPSMNRFKSALEVLEKDIGVMSIVYHSALTGTQFLLDTDNDGDIDGEFESDNDTSIFIQPAILDALSDLFSYLASSNFGPTIDARLLYIFFFSVTASYNSIAGSKTGVYDTWDWGVKTPLDIGSWYAWMQQTLAFCMPNLVPGWTNGATYTTEFSAFSTRWTTWFTYRSGDGNVAARTPPAYTVLNHNTTTNAITYLETTTSQDFTNTSNYQNSSLWTPLSINGTHKNYLTYGWGSVTSPSLLPSDESAIMSTANAYFPSAGARTTEILALLAMSQSLTDTQKVIAEFWAGGPNTVTPPGMSVWLWKEFMLCQTVSLDTFFYSGLDLTIGLFEASRLCWALKGSHLEARPIQEIRKGYASSTITKYDGTSILGNVWVPYQPSTIVTPAFPDFPSGHSTFTQIFANVMTDWFGATLPTTPTPFSQASLFSPVLSPLARNPYGTFTIIPNSLAVQTTVPASTVTLTFTTWQDIANQAGISRQYGGIHAESANVGGQALANSLRAQQKLNWPLR